MSVDLAQKLNALVWSVLCTYGKCMYSPKVSDGKTHKRKRAKHKSEF